MRITCHKRRILEVGLLHPACTSQNIDSAAARAIVTPPVPAQRLSARSHERALQDVLPTSRTAARLLRKFHGQHLLRGEVWVYGVCEVGLSWPAGSALAVVDLVSAIELSLLLLLLLGALLCLLLRLSRRARNFLAPWSLHVLIVRRPPHNEYFFQADEGMFSPLLQNFEPKQHSDNRSKLSQACAVICMPCAFAPRISSQRMQFVCFWWISQIRTATSCQGGMSKAFST